MARGGAHRAAAMSPFGAFDAGTALAVNGIATAAWINCERGLPTNDPIDRIPTQTNTGNAFHQTLSLVAAEALEPRVRAHLGTWNSLALHDD